MIFRTVTGSISMQFCWFMLGLPVSLALLVEFKKI